QLGLERSVAKCVLLETTTGGEVERLELIGEAGAAAGRPARDARLEFVDQPFERPPRFRRHAPRTAPAVILVPALFWSEQRAAVVTDEAVEDVAVAVVRAQRSEVSRRAHAFERGRDETVLRVVQTANAGCGEVGSIRNDDGIVLALDQRAQRAAQCQRLVVAEQVRAGLCIERVGCPLCLGNLTRVARGSERRRLETLIEEIRQVTV